MESGRIGDMNFGDMTGLRSNPDRVPANSLIWVIVSPEACVNMQFVGADENPPMASGNLGRVGGLAD